MVVSLDPIPFPKDLDYTKQGIEVPSTRKPGQTGHYRNGIWPELITAENQPLHTLPDIWQSGLAKDPNAACLGHRPLVGTNPLTYGPYVWETYAQVDARIKAVGSTLHHWFTTGRLVRTEEGYECVGIWSVNRPEWQIIDQAVQHYAKVGVSLYDTLGPDSVQYIINHASLSVIFVTPQHIVSLLTQAANIPTLKIIVSLDPLPDTTKPLIKAWAKDKGIEILEMPEVEAYGRANPLPAIPAKSSQLASICYTSGTTGNPKGALLTHGNLAVAIASNIYGARFERGGILLSYLPLAHIYERFAELICIALGGKIGYFTGDPLRLLEDAQVLKPNYFPGVPRILNRVYGAAQASMNAPGLKGMLLRRAVAAKLALWHASGVNIHPFWDRLVFKKIQAMLGGQVYMLTSGAAPISKDAMNFLKIAFACDVVEGYGMTENCATCMRVLPNDKTATGTVGPPQPCNEIKLVDVPAMGYTSLDKPNPRGELCVRGANCFGGYYKDAKNTKETLDEEGWLHSGDVAEVDSWGRFKIIDRIKNIMKLAQGEYVALEKVENTYSTTPIVSQIFVYGDSLRDYLVAVVVPDPMALSVLATNLGVGKIDPTNIAALDAALKEGKVHQAIKKELDNEAKKQGLKGFETVKQILITNEQFTVENGTLTPTFKIKRKETYAKYKKELDALYDGPKAAL